MKVENVDAYIANQPGHVAVLLESVRQTIKKAAPKAEEVISYSMPAFKMNEMLVWYAAHSKHIGFYPRVSAMEAFKNDLSEYQVSKGAVQFPFDKPLPLALITKIVEFRVAENLQKAGMKKK
jgi:uncharacterized protein YdhG (YjbR/CyaY superfamily)